MKTKNTGDADSFSIKSGNYNITLKLSSEKKNLTLITENSSSTYEDVFTLGSLIDIDQKFRAFFSVQEVFEELRSGLQKKNLEVKNGETEITLLFNTIGSIVKLPLQKVVQKIDKEMLISQLNDEISKYKENIKALTSELEKVKKYNAELEKKHSNQNDTLGNKTELIQSILQEITKNKTHQIPEYKMLDSPEFSEEKTDTGYEVSEIELKKKINAHLEPVSAICLTKDGRLASCSDDKTIKIFSLSTYECELTLEGHKLCVTYVSVLSNGNLISSSRDKTIKIWSINKNEYQCLQTLTGHSGEVNKVLQYNKNKFGSCSNDKTIKIWNKKSPFKCTKTLTGHEGIVISFIGLKNNKYIVSASAQDYVGGFDEKQIRFWNASTYECEKIINDIECCDSNSLFEVENRLIIGETEGIAIINLETLEVESKIRGALKNAVSFLQIDSKNLLCGCMLEERRWSLVKVDIQREAVTKLKENSHDYDISGLLKVGENIISCSRDNSIKIWNFK